MAYIENQIHTAASKNAELLTSLRRTDYAKPALQQQISYISGLENDSATNRANLSQLSTKLAKELKDHEKYKDSIIKRFAYKAFGQEHKFEEHAAKEERNYFDAVHAEQHAKQEAEQLARQLEEARRHKAELEKNAAEHDLAQRELDSLYSSIFAGVTPAYPEEDHQENLVRDALDAYQRQELNLQGQQQVQQILQGAQQAMNSALSSVQDALRASMYDMFSRGRMADVMERSALAQVETAVRQVYLMNDQAGGMSDAVSRLPVVQIAHGNVIGDILFDNRYSDIRFHQKIEATKDDLIRASTVLQQNQAAVEQRCNSVRQEMSNASQRLESARVELQKLRESIFQRVAMQES